MYPFARRGYYRAGSDITPPPGLSAEMFGWATGYSAVYDSIQGAADSTAHPPAGVQKKGVTMATIHTNENVVCLRLKMGETAIVEFQPEGLNAVPGSPIVSFLIDTVALPGGRMALTIGLPEANHFVGEHGTIFLLDNPSGADELVFDELLGIPSLRVRKPRGAR